MDQHNQEVGHHIAQHDHRQPSQDMDYASWTSSKSRDSQMSVIPPIYLALTLREPDLGCLDSSNKERRERDETRRREHSLSPASTRTHWRHL